MCVLVQKITRHERNRWPTAASTVQPQPRLKLIHSQLVRRERREDYEYPVCDHGGSDCNRAILRAIYKVEGRVECNQILKFFILPWLIDSIVKVLLLMPNFETSDILDAIRLILSESVLVNKCSIFN